MSCADKIVLSINEFSKMTSEDVAKYVQETEDSEITEFLLRIRQKRAISWEDRALLQMIDKSPLTFWASDKAYRVVLWSNNCTNVYNRQLLGKPFMEIMSIYERSEAMKDSIRVIEADLEELPTLVEEFANYYTKDLKGTTRAFGLITNSMQLIDDETGEKFYAEIGLPFEPEQQLGEYEDRKKKLEESVSEFESSVSYLRDEFENNIKLFREKISKATMLTQEQRKQLRRVVATKESELSNNLKKYKSALDFKKFIRQNEEALNEAIIEIKKSIEDAIEKGTPPNMEDSPNGTETLISDIDKTSEIIKKTFDIEIMEKTAQTLSVGLRAKRVEILKELQEERDMFLRELEELKMAIPSSPAATLRAIKFKVEAMDVTMREKIDDIVQGRNKDGKNKK